MLVDERFGNTCLATLTGPTQWRRFRCERAGKWIFIKYKCKYKYKYNKNTSGVSIIIITFTLVNNCYPLISIIIINSTKTVLSHFKTLCSRSLSAHIHLVWIWIWLCQSIPKQWDMLTFNLYARQSEKTVVWYQN